jgi:hypothetical protein
MHLINYIKKRCNSNSPPRQLFFSFSSEKSQAATNMAPSKHQGQHILSLEKLRTIKKEQ